MTFTTDYKEHGSPTKMVCFADSAKIIVKEFILGMEVFLCVCVCVCVCGTYKSYMKLGCTVAQKCTGHSVSISIH